jgi:hypothetical protein
MFHQKFVVLYLKKCEWVVSGAPGALKSGRQPPGGLTEASPSLRVEGLGGKLFLTSFTSRFFMHGCWDDRGLPILLVSAAPPAPETCFRAAGISKIGDFRSAPKPGIKNASVQSAARWTLHLRVCEASSSPDAPLMGNPINNGLWGGSSLLNNEEPCYLTGFCGPKIRYSRGVPVSGALTREPHDTKEIPTRTDMDRNPI